MPPLRRLYRKRVGNEFRRPLKYDSGEKDESGVFDFLDKLR
jgi:hypothetical protein